MGPAARCSGSWEYGKWNRLGGQKIHPSASWEMLGKGEVLRLGGMWGAVERVEWLT